MLKEWRDKKILFLGDSITHNGLYVDFFETYLIQYYFSSYEGEIIRLGLSSETVSGLSEKEHPFPRPCLSERLDRTLKAIQPDVVFLCYGMNDGIYAALEETRFAAFREGMLSAIEQIRQTGAQIVVMTPTPFDPNSFSLELSEEPVPDAGYLHPYKYYNKTLEAYAQWVMTLGEQEGVLATIDLFTPMSEYLSATYERNPGYSSGDGIHPNSIGHWVIAKAMIKQLFNITLNRMPFYVQKSRPGDYFNLLWFDNETISNAWRESIGHTNPNKEMHALSVEQAYAKSNRSQVIEMARQDAKRIAESKWKGYRRLDFYLDGREGILIAPEQPREDGMWIWRTEFFGAFDQADMALLEQGYYLAYYCLSDMYGSPKAVSLMEEFRGFVMGYFKLSGKPILFGFSRGGMYAVNYAAKYFQSVTALYLDAPVLDMNSWPRGMGKGSGNALCWEGCKKCYGVNEEEALTTVKNPIRQLPVLRRANIPIILVAGGQDQTVPYEENGAKLAELYQDSSLFRVIVKPDCGHHPHSLEDPTPIVEFCNQCTLG